MENKEIVNRKNILKIKCLKIQYTAFVIEFVNYTEKCFNEEQIDQKRDMLLQRLIACYENPWICYDLCKKLISLYDKYYDRIPPITNTLDSMISEATSIINTLEVLISNESN